MAIARFIYRRFLNSVPVGIAILVSIALYVAVGSGVVGLREWLEMDEMLFFNWWPLKLLVVALIVNLSVVTVSRIPLTVPRYGVWCIHLGIILLLMSLSAYYFRKVEGYVPLAKGQIASDFYDRWERSLYLRTQFSTNRGVPLKGLPRFAAYDPSLGNAGTLDRPTLKGLQPQMAVIDQQSGRRSRVSLAEAIGVTDPVRLDVVGYYPYGQIERWRVDPKATGTALRVRPATDVDPNGGMWLVADRPLESVVPIGPAAIEYRHLPTAADVKVATTAARQLHKLSIKVGTANDEQNVEPGETYAAGDYTILVEGFTPGFELSSRDGKRADMLAVLVTKKNADGTSKTFRRTILAGSNQQTDFELGVVGAGPFGKRLKEGLLDDALTLGYRFSDPTKLLSTVADTTVKYILFTRDDGPGITLLRVSSREPSVVNAADDQVDLHVTAPAAMFSADGAPQDVADLVVTRVDHVAPSDAVIDVPKAKRDREVASTGRGQVVRVRVSCGTWSQVVPVAYDPFAIQNPWSSPKVKVPGATGEFQMMLGNQLLPLPIDVRLDGFEAVPYAGGDVSTRSVMRDFRSTITVFDRGDDANAAPPRQSMASMNNPAFLKIAGPVWFVPGESWLLSQASWDPSNLDSTVLQVGNRPAVGMMITACFLIFGGLMYAFYAKPIIIRRMKQNALRDARAATEMKMQFAKRPTNENVLESV